MTAAPVTFGEFVPGPPLLPGRAAPECRAVVTVPVRNEENRLGACLDALASQVGPEGESLGREQFEVLLLLNNCTDRSAAVVRQWARVHPAMVLLAAERELPPAEAHAGTARRLLMDTAWYRLGGTARPWPCAILATDADSTAAPDWIWQNLRALEAGADAVGGTIELGAEDLQALPPAVRRCYGQDRRYAALIARLEHALDPQVGDPWPRHLDHFGSSLACTPEAYAAAGGMPAVASLEDEAFVDRLRRANLRLRHEPAVRVCTSGRLEGRAAMGMARQLRGWSELGGVDAHTVASAAFLAHRFGWMRRLRAAYAAGDSESLAPDTPWWRNQFREAMREPTVAGFLAEIYCDVLIREAFAGVDEEPIAEAIAALEAMLGGA